MLNYLAGDEIKKVMAETHEGAGGNHSEGRALAMRIKKLSFYWPTMIKDCVQ